MDNRLIKAARARAEHLRQVMVMEGVAPGRLMFRAVGGAEPLVDTRPREHAVVNTRVEFFVAERR
jgi:outer membrane protein OmpA-like peptidoglycan-associated protein